MAQKSSKINFQKSILINALIVLGFLGSWGINFQNPNCINALIHFEKKNVQLNLGKLLADVRKAAP